MNFERLRQLLLEKAIQGKLVPQSESEPEVKQIGEVPADVALEIPKKWKWIKLDNLISIISGTSYKPSDVSSEGIRIIRGGNIDNFKISFKPNDVFLPESFKEEKQVVKNTDIVIVASTGSLEVIGKPGVISDESSGQCQIGAFLRIVRPKQAEFAQYLRIIFMSDFYRNQIRGLVKGTNIRNIKREYLTEMFIPVPPLAEQQRIASRLDELFAVIKKAEDAYADMQRMSVPLRNQILQLAIQGKLVPQLESEPEVEQIGETPVDVPFEIPKKWKWVFLKNISKKIHYGYTTSAKETGNCHLLRITDIKPDGVDWKTVPFCEIDEKGKKFLLEDRDIVIARTGGTIGKSFMVENVCGSSVFASYLIRVQPVEKYVSSKYLVHFLSSSEYWKQLSDASRGTGQPNVNAVALGNLCIPLPSLAEQQRIVACLDELLFQVNQLKC